jgi:hypothetical protein
LLILLDELTAFLGCFIGGWKFLEVDVETKSSNKVFNKEGGKI